MRKALAVFLFLSVLSVNSAYAGWIKMKIPYVGVAFSVPVPKFVDEQIEKYSRSNEQDRRAQHEREQRDRDRGEREREQRDYLRKLVEADKRRKELEARDRDFAQGKEVQEKRLLADRYFENAKEKPIRDVREKQDRVDVDNSRDRGVFAYQLEVEKADAKAKAEKAASDLVEARIRAEARRMELNTQKADGTLSLDSVSVAELVDMLRHAENSADREYWASMIIILSPANLEATQFLQNSRGWTQDDIEGLKTMSPVNVAYGALTNQNLAANDVIVQDLANQDRQDRDSANLDLLQQMPVVS